uniref:TF-B3 domain-containing protein n=1 Tax=Chenopodium quinoa TaxID=63459 RepID=A0A803LYG5_CHEQI
MSILLRRMFLLYQLTIPAEGVRLLPNIEAPVILTRGTESWTMNYIVNDIVNKRLDKRWKQFAVDNKLKVGDVCTFELMSKVPEVEGSSPSR